MADSTRIQGERVKCYECPNRWPRDQGGLQCPRCDSEFVEIISNSSPSSPDLPPRPDSSDDMNLTRSRSMDSFEHHNLWPDVPDPDVPDPDEDDIDNLHHGHGHDHELPPQPRTYHWQSRSPNGSSSFSVSMFSSGGPMSIRAEGGGRPAAGDPAVAEIEQHLQNLVQNIMGIRPQVRPQDRNAMPGNRPPMPGFPFAPPDPPGPPDQAGGGGGVGLLGALFQGFGARAQGNTEANLSPFAMLQRMLDPVNSAHGDAVFTQEAFDRVMTQLMEQNQGSNAPGPASEAAIRSLPKKQVEKGMLDDRGQAECSICMDGVQLGETVTALPCTHWFHEACITAWLKEHDTCPHCRKSITQLPEPSRGGASRASGGQPSRPPRRSSSGSMAGSWNTWSGTLRNPVIVEDETSPVGHANTRAGRRQQHNRQRSEDLDRRETPGRRWSSLPTTSSTPGRRRYRGSERHSQRSGSGSRDRNNNRGGFTNWVRSLGGGGGGGGGG